MRRKRATRSRNIRTSIGVLGSMAVVLALTGDVAYAATGSTSSSSAHVGMVPAQTDVMPPGLDVAIDKAVTSTTDATSTTLSNAVDGDASTVWYPDAATTQTITVDLGAQKTLSGVGITWAGSTEGAHFEVALSPDGQHWFTPPGVTDEQGIAVTSSIQYVDFHGHSVHARFARLTVDQGSSSGLGVAEFRVFAPSEEAAQSMLLGDDVSTMAQEEAIGSTYSENGRTQPMLQILKSGGANYARLRLWVNPPGGNNDLQQDLAMAREIKVAGMKLYLDIHYSDFWADPGKQTTPAAWQGEDLNQLSNTVKSYTQSVMQAFAAQGTPVDMVSIGNEITDGMLWPTGQLYLPNGTQQWSQFTTLLKAGIAGAHLGNPAGHPLKVMLHIDRGGDNAGAEWFFDHVLQAGVNFDVIGLSYYPWWHGSLASFKANIDALATKYNKDIVVSETQYPWTLQNGDSLENQVTANTTLLPGYPPTPQGQASYVRDVVSLVAAVPNHRGLGVCYWEPAWLPGVGWEPGAGTSADNLTEFNWQGQALPAVNAYQVGWSDGERWW